LERVIENNRGRLLNREGPIATPPNELGQRIQLTHTSIAEQIA
jgi:hypothetical protein